MSKFEVAIEVSNLISKSLKLLNFEATSMPGKIIQKICPSFLNKSSKYITYPKFAVTGTNGKTTTSGILSEILQKKGLDAINNKLGANMPNGIVTSIASGLYKKKREGCGAICAQGAVLECDEAYFSYISDKFPFDYLIITNLFRDQLDRYGEMDIARKKIISGIGLSPDIKIIMNADDPSLCEIEEELKYKKDKFIYYGITEVKYEGYEKKSNSPNELIYCTKCREPIKYKERFYAQLGDWYCNCSNKRKKLDVSAKVTVFPDRSILDVMYKYKFYTFEVNLAGLYNAYNALGAIAGALIADVDSQTIKNGLLSYRPVFGRHQQIKLKNGGTLTIHLIKNPVGASEVLRGLKNLQNSRILISINDNYADGKDVSWLYDADFEALSNFSNVIYTTGQRSYDMALRLKLADFNLNFLDVFDNTNKVTESIIDAIYELNENENLTVLVTYTGLLEIQKNMKKLLKKCAL